MTKEMSKLTEKRFVIVQSVHMSFIKKSLAKDLSYYSEHKELKSFGLWFIYTLSKNNKETISVIEVRVIDIRVIDIWVIEYGIKDGKCSQKKNLRNLH